MPVSKAAMNKLVVNHLVTEGFKVTSRISHDASVQGSLEQAHHELKYLSRGGTQCRTLGVPRHDASVQASHGLRTNLRGRDSNWFGRNRYYFFDAISFII
jgi:hypothetical protein